MRLVILTAASSWILAGAGAAAAQEDTIADAPAASRRPVQEIVIHGVPLNRGIGDMAGAFTSLDGDRLVANRRATLGDTLDGEAGIHSDSFGGGASRPVIRGQTAPRVKVLSDSSEIMDASAVSPDHAIAAEPLLLERIEVLRGPAALLYGGGAIGGAVNLIDKKIPAELPENGLEGVAELRFGSVNDEKAGVAGLTMGFGNLAVRMEGALRRSDDYRAPKTAGGDVPATYNDGETGSLGLSWVGDSGYFGAAFTRQRSEYGIPGHSHGFEECRPEGGHLHCDDDDDHDHDHDHDHDDHDEASLGVPFVKLRSDRIDIRGEYRNPVEAIERIRLRAGITDYEHDEIEGGVIATTFKNEGFDGRLEVEHAPLGGLHGVVGLQAARSKFDAIGLESYLPASTTKSGAIFVMEEYHAGDLRLELALRQEWQKITPEGPAPTAEHSPFSISAAGIWSLPAGYSLGLSLGRAERAPNAQELFAQGIHLATNSYELGNPDLGKEATRSVELTLRKAEGKARLSLGVFHYRVDDYIYAATLDRVDDMRLVQYEAADARFTGVDGSFTYGALANLDLTIFGDYVRGKFVEAGDLPRMPGGRLGGRMEMSAGGVNATVEYFRLFRQDRIAVHETATPGHDMVSLTVAYDLDLGGASGQIYLTGDNLLNEVARNHSSFIKDSVPLPGRNFVLGLRATF